MNLKNVAKRKSGPCSQRVGQPDGFCCVNCAEDGRVDADAEGEGFGGRVIGWRAVTRSPTTRQAPSSARRFRFRLKPER